MAIRRKQEMGASDSEILLLRNLKDYFLCEWVPHDPVTKGNIARGVTHLFGDLTPALTKLLKTFCQPSRFGFEDLFEARAKVATSWCRAPIPTRKCSSVHA